MRKENLLLLLSLCLMALPAAGQGQKYWLTGGQNTSNTRHAASETRLSAANAGSLKLNWAFTTAGDVSATPAVDDGAVYFPDWKGNLYRVDARTGALRWRKEIREYIAPTPATAFARATPAIAGNALFIGTQQGEPKFGAYVLGINKNNGSLLWKTQVDAHPDAIVTQSAVVYGNKVYVGVASLEEATAANPFYPCCSFRGSMVCLDAGTGKILWKTYTVPEGKGFSGNAVWGSTPVIDPKRNSVYITTGNNYTVPQAILDIVAAGGTPEQVKSSIMAVDGSAENYFDAILALDLNTGKVKWSKLAIPFDAWTVACFFDGPNCPENAGPDYDFGQGPALFSVGSGAGRRELLGAGQKSGQYWVVNPDNGQEVWTTQVGPGGTLGGLQWGSAVDGKQIYTAVSNNDFTPHLMTTGPGAGTTVRGGFWAALDAATGAVVWETAAAKAPAFGPFDGAVAINTGMVTVANGVVLAGSMDAQGTMYAFNAATGEQLWSFLSGGSVNSGPAVVDGNVYWGSGYANFGFGTGNTKLYSFGLPANSAARMGPANLADPSISVYPTLATQTVKIVSKDRGNIRSIRVFDLAGRLVKELGPTGTASYELDLRAVPAGTYLVKIATLAGSTSAKVVVLR
ncbi:MAG: PQQ-binding-like beta-propeller repeat protein [Cytophagales bacterium]|nr:PQQ-binding-like beta-propeller repeat protein [Cytophagales bacterium]